MASNRSFQAFEDHLKCNICETGPRPGKSRWYRCMALHQVCQDCKEVKKVKKCSCGQLVSHAFDKMTESWLNEESMKFKCVNQGRGCQEILRKEDLKFHETECIYRLVLCPVRYCKKSTYTFPSNGSTHARIQ